MVFIWILSFSFKFGSIVSSSTVNWKNNTCSGWNWSLQVKQKLGIITILIEYFLPLIFLIISYFHMAFKMFYGAKSAGDSIECENLQNEGFYKRKQNMEKAGRNLFKTLVMVTIAFAVCNSPGQICFLFINFGVQIPFGSLYRSLVMISFFNMIVNPFIYALQYKEFQNEIKKMIPWENNSKTNSIEIFNRRVS